MKIWLDAHLSTVLAPWFSSEFSVSATALRDLALRNATDGEIFPASRKANAIVMTKDADFVHRVPARFGGANFSTDLLSK